MRWQTSPPRSAPMSEPAGRKSGHMIGSQARISIQYALCTDYKGHGARHASGADTHAEGGQDQAQRGNTVRGDAVLGGPILELGPYLHCLVDRILGHLTICGPLAARDGHQPTVDHIDHMVPAQLLGVGGVGIRIANQRPQPSPGGADRGAIELVAENPVDFGQDKVHLVVCCPGFVRDVARRVGGAGDGAADGVVVVGAVVGVGACCCWCW